MSVARNDRRLIRAAADSCNKPQTERRSIEQRVELRSPTSRTIGGDAAVFRSRSENLGGFIEQINPRFFNKSGADGWPNVVCRFNHQDNFLLGTTRADTLRLELTNRALTYDVDIPEARADVLELVTRGDVTHSSFAFQCYEDDWTVDAGTPLRTLLSGRLIDVAPVTVPAYRDASVGLRSLADYTHTPIEDVRKLADKDELRRLLTRSDRPPALPGHGHRWKRGAHAALIADLTRKKTPPAGTEIRKDGRQALVETMGKRWPSPRKAAR